MLGQAWSPVTGRLGWKVILGHSEKEDLNGTHNRPECSHKQEQAEPGFSSSYGGLTLRAGR